MSLTSPAAAPRALQAGDLAAALDWWREAGVDLDFTDTARDWLEARSAVAPDIPEPATAEPIAQPAPPPRPKIGGEPASWPADLATFAEWWLSEPALDSGQVFARVPPRGPRNAVLMVMVDHPEAKDSQHLLAGEQGKLLSAILSALGIAPDQAYVASLLPRHMPLPDWAELQSSGLGELALHHIGLVAPQRLISFGTHVSSLLGHVPAKSADPQAPFYRTGAGIPALAAPALSTLAVRPRGKAALWQALLDWQAA